MAAGGGGGAGAAACAACKYQRRRCTPDCLLAEFFPHDRPRLFRNAHRLFGVSNIIKTLVRAGPEKRREAMHCIIYESQAWEIHPATGCVPIIHGLQHRIRQAELDLQRVYDAINAYRAAAAAQGRSVPDSDSGDPSASSSTPPPFQLQPSEGNNDEEAYGGGLPPLMNYGGDQQQMMMSTAASDDDINLALQMQTWMTQPPQYDMTSGATAVADIAAGRLAPQPPQQDPRFLVDATMAPPSQHPQLQQLIPIQPAAELDDDMSYFVDGMDDENEMATESTSMDDSSDKMAMIKAPKMEDANGLK